MQRVVLFMLIVVTFVQEKIRKKKKIKAIKAKNKSITVDAEITATQQTWKNFVHKVLKLCTYPMRISYHAYTNKFAGHRFKANSTGAIGN